MAERSKPRRAASSFLTNLILIIICVVWMVPIVGVLITSFRPSERYLQDWLVDGLSRIKRMFRLAKSNWSPP